MARKLPKTLYVHMEEDVNAGVEYPLCDETLEAAAPDAGESRRVGIYKLIETADLTVEAKLTKRSIKK